MVVLTLTVALQMCLAQAIPQWAEHPATPPAPHWIDQGLTQLSNRFPESSYFHEVFHWRMLIGLILVSLSCGAVGSLVVGGRMAFFSDALAHCAFASVSIGFVLFTLLLSNVPDQKDVFWDWVTPVMLLFGMGFGFGIAWVRERTGLASDTVIGIFFAFSIGLAAMIRQVMQNRALFGMEDFLFGDPLRTRAEDLVQLAMLAMVTLVLMGFTFNQLLLSSCNTSLALSRRMRLQLVSYLFIMLLAVVVNLCVRSVGVLLINALLVVPAATAMNVARNIRQMFWLTVLLCLFACLAGPLICWEFETRLPRGVRLGIPGTIILVSVGMFVLSASIGPWLKERKNTQPS